MNWLKKVLDAVAKAPKWLLGVTATVGGVAGTVAAIAAIPGIGLPVAVGVVATKVLIASGAIAVAAAKAMPGHGDNAPPAAATTPVKP